MDKKAEMLSHGPKALHPQITHSPNQQQQQPSTQTIVNSTNNNSSVSNNNRKSSETVTSSPEDHIEEQPPKVQGESPVDIQTSQEAAAKALANALDEEADDPPDNAELPIELQQAPETTETSNSVIANVDSKKGEEIETPGKNPEVSLGATKNDDDSLGVKKVSASPFD